MLKMTWRRAAAWRIERHYLAGRAPAGSMVAVASRLCGLHAQLMSSAELTLWARVEDLERGELQTALWERRTLIKTWAMRGTLHLLPASELPLWHAALSTSPRYRKPARWQKYFGITMEELDHLTAAVGRVLDGRILTREELAQAVGELIGSRKLGAKLAEGSWSTILKPAAFAGLLCFAPSQGQRVRFTCPRSWLKEHLPAVSPQVATTMIARRFLAAYGPATYHDLARWWTGGRVSTARQWIASLGEEACPVEVDGTPAWALSSDVHELGNVRSENSVCLLPAFDPYVLGVSYHAEKLLCVNLRHRVYRPQGWISPVLLVNGFIAGTWQHEMKGSRVEVTIRPFSKLASWARKGAAQEAERLASFLRATLRLA